MGGVDRRMLAVCTQGPMMGRLTRCCIAGSGCASRRDLNVVQEAFLELVLFYLINWNHFESAWTTQVRQRRIVALEEQEGRRGQWGE